MRKRKSVYWQLVAYQKGWSVIYRKVEVLLNWFLQFIKFVVIWNSFYPLLLFLYLAATVCWGWCGEGNIRQIAKVFHIQYAADWACGGPEVLSIPLVSSESLKSWLLSSLSLNFYFTLHLCFCRSQPVSQIKLWLLGISTLAFLYLHVKPSPSHSWS